MCEELVSLRDALCGYVERFEPDVCSGELASAVMAQACAIESAAARLKALAASRVASTNSWRSAGDRSAAHHLARTTGTTVSAAIES